MTSSYACVFQILKSFVRYRGLLRMVGMTMTIKIIFLIKMNSDELIVINKQVIFTLSDTGSCVFEC
jgi:hypothetical protein